MGRDGDAIGQKLGELEGLYAKDPQEFEKKRRELIALAIEQLPPERRARAYGLQFRLDAELGRIAHPLARFNHMVCLFWEQFAKFEKVMNDPSSVVRERETREPAAVIPLRKS